MLEVCPVCNGSQEVIENLYTHINSATGINFVKCRSCNGQGFIPTNIIDCEDKKCI